ncbi:thiamine diphosphokinase [Yoonia sp. MH D7]
MSIVHSLGPIVLVGAAYIGPKELNIFQSLTKQFVGIDGGADHLLAVGIDPVAVIGDLDSLSDASRTRFAAVLHHIAEQETVDFEKGLSRVNAPLIYALGFAGGRLDHTLAVLHVMGRNPERPVLLISADDASAIVPSRGLTLHLPIGTRVSIMPLADARVQGQGLRWPISDRPMHPMHFTSPSNAAADHEVQISCTGPVIVTVPRAQMQALGQAVARAR